MAVVGGGVILFFVFFLGVTVLGTVFWIWCLVDLLRRPDQDYTAASQNKVLWLLVVLFAHFVGGLLYLFIARPELERVTRYRY